MSKSLKKSYFDHEEEVETFEKPDLSIVGDKTLPDFNIKSEYSSRDIKLRELSEEEKKSPTHTTVKVYQEDGVTSVEPGKLHELINSNKRIKKVVIEKISVEDAARISMLFGNKSSEKVLNPEQIDAENLKNAEMKLNFNYLGEIPVSNENELPYDEQALNFNIPADIEEIPVLEEDNEKRETTCLKLISRSEEENSITSTDKLLPQGDISELQDKKLSYDKHTLTRKKNSSHHGYYYRAKDHMELYKIGSSYMVDYNNGLKSLAFSGHGLNSQREKSVFGVLSYFNYHIDLNICIVTMNYFESFYYQMMGDIDYRSIQALDEDFEYKIYDGKGVEIIEFTELKKVERKLRQYDFEYFLDVLIENYDLVLWDLPDLEVLNSNKEVYFPIVRTIDNVSLIVGENYSKFRDIEETIDYFKRYQINVKGVLVNKDKS